ncbi:hypothetical protein CXG81DRAFT_11328 [Caulochytrium protostelioides]|uniref:Glutamine synthetase/guanido kinase n=1 Tax=Caulochytrium protostelioides TaxID=1555241 RepID=A0A4P9WWI2_9FUNG|nr:glutamine synthetase/guanido kinase [Caulochytrium protostelioides]RKP01981.1 hypothetical protein CXG81DRAFT_11328 [Caulochytrium protostelioides]|eukprot:RKP01981.1 hypothetical protein CXG81DRAFT_11328 [Caulochytrium protostelioides]
MAYPSETFGENVFSLSRLAETLPKPVFARFIQQVQGRTTLDKDTADAVAHAVKVWAMNHGATHFTHWFQPQTGTTAEKHDSFLTLRNVTTNGVEEVRPLDIFSGSQLLQSEPDASSFPNGGMRSTFEARGYTIWDTTSPMFLRNAAHGTQVLYIPSVFISYNGEALDEKTTLLRSSEAISNATVRLLHLLGETHVKRAYTTLGTEQEFFLVDRQLYNLRPDLRMCGRAIFGAPPPKHQQLEDHYFGQMPSRVLAAISEAELELAKLGVPIKTRHNEVAPNQFEVAPIFEEASVAVDHNLLVMETLHQVAHRHKLKVLFHEKPFNGVNGSGKHCNWSISTADGENLLEPTAHPEENMRFVLVLVATLDAVHRHGGLLRAAIASAGNEHRLGANEAPPSIVSAFLGDQLTEVLNSIEEGRSIRVEPPKRKGIKVGGTVLDLQVRTLPTIARDLTDRNRTSAFAFTGNKFEFRAVGSKQSPSFPMVLLNAAVAQSLNELTDDLTKQMGSRTVPSKDDIRAVLKIWIKRSKPIRFEGNGYSQDWIAEAEARGLPHIRTCPEAFAQLLDPSHSKALVTQGVLTQEELHSRYHILMEKYCKDMLIEANTMHAIATQGILPAVFAYRKELAESLVAQKAIGVDAAAAPEKSVLDKSSELTVAFQKEVGVLAKTIEEITSAEPLEGAKIAAAKLFTLLRSLGDKANDIENLVGDKYWPYPKFPELLF